MHPESLSNEKPLPERSLRSPGTALILIAVACAGGLVACDACSSEHESAGAADAGVSGLSPERAAQVLAKVGQRTITLGDYAAALERMDPFERLRYQTEDRRQALLDEMINVELLAREAERRGLDKRPETVELVRQFQRDEVLRQIRSHAPKPESISPAEVSSYYQAHRQEFLEPERRRGAHIALADEALARRVLEEAQSANAEGWRALVARYATPPPAVAAAPPSAGPPADQDPSSARPALQVPGDLGFSSLEQNGSSAEAATSDAVRRALFDITEVGHVHPQLVADGGRFIIVRLVSKIDARQRTLEEAETAIRLRLVQALQERAEADLIANLRRTVPIQIDEATLGAVAPPSPTPAPAAKSP
jgi:peptidyl-prolyl cis-trans isomerase C